MGFSTLPTNCNMQNLQYYNEIIRGINERYGFNHGGATLFDLFNDGLNIQDRNMWWHQLQYTVLNILADDYWKHSTELDGVTIGYIPNPYSSNLNDLYGDAGVYYGLRRAAGNYPSDWTNYYDPAFSYGYIQDGDIIGPWLLKDLQDLLKAMRFTIFDLLFYGPNKSFYAHCNIEGQEDCEPDCGEYTRAEAFDYIANGWTSVSPATSEHGLRLERDFHYAGSPPNAEWGGHMARSKGVIYANRNLFTGATYNLKVYAYTDPRNWPSGYTPDIVTEVGIDYDDKYHFLKEIASIDANDFYDSTEYGGTSYTIAPINAEPTEDGSDDFSHSVEINIKGLAKCNFVWD